MPLDSYKYVEVFSEGNGRKGYVYIGQNCLTLALVLYLTKMRHLRALGFGKDSLEKFIKHTFSLWNAKPLLELPVRGNLCLQVHRGYLVFDIEREKVYKVFDEATPITSFKQEISWLLRCRKMASVPYLRRWDVQRRWFEMDYINGKRGLFLYKLSPDEYINAYYDYIEPFLLQLLEVRPPRLVTAADYAGRIVASSKLSKLNESGVDENAAREVRDFLYMQLESLHTKKDEFIYLTASHGDLSPGNIIGVKGRIMVVDWEDTDYRSALHDFHNIFLRVHARFLSKSDINAAMFSLKERLIKHRPEVAESLLAEADTYRWVFYIEKICKIMRRDITEKRLGDILRSVRYFWHYEQCGREKAVEDYCSNSSILKG